MWIDYSVFSLEVEDPETAGTEVAGSEVAGSATAGSDVVCLLYTSPSPRDQRGSRMPSSA